MQSNSRKINNKTTVSCYHYKIYPSAERHLLDSKSGEFMLQHIDSGLVLFHGHEFSINQRLDSIFDERIFIGGRTFCNVLVQPKNSGQRKLAVLSLESLRAVTFKCYLIHFFRAQRFRTVPMRAFGIRKVHGIRSKWF